MQAATVEQLTKAYRSLARKHHPDKPTGDSAVFTAVFAPSQLQQRRAHLAAAKSAHSRECTLADIKHRPLHQCSAVAGALLMLSVGVASEA